ncbi:MAG: ThuA domain-containing protein [Spirochaetales bacterium]|nr:ThuA domain-containing protein [Spirochaetales bacterium]
MEKTKRALITWGGWEGHEPEQCALIFRDILEEKGYKVTVADKLDCYTDADLMNSLDLIVPVWTMSKLEKEQWEGLRDTVRKGCGIAGWHGGMGDSFRDNPDYQFMVGGQWVAHPGNIIDHTVQICSEDPIVQGISEISLKSEQYYMHVDPGNEVLATTIFKGDQDGMDWIAGTVMPVVWKRRYGKARVFYSSMGHVASDFDFPGVKEIMTRGMLWATR